MKRLICVRPNTVMRLYAQNMAFKAVNLWKVKKKKNIHQATLVVHRL